MAQDREQGQERTEQPSSRRLQQARERGQVPRSRELTTMAVVLASAGALALLGGWALQRLAAMLRSGLSLTAADLADPYHGLTDRFLDRMLEGLLSAAPFLVVALLGALLAPLLVGGWSFSTEALGFKGERLSPLAGLGRLFSRRSLAELAKALVKFFLVTGVAVWLLWSELDALLHLGREPLPAALAHAGHLLVHTLLGLATVLVVIAAADVPFQIWEHTRGLRMTRQELREELKETEGRPEVRSRIRSLQREMAQRRMMHEVPKADVVVTNPTHYAVALRYDAAAMNAPRVVASGADLLALRIRQVAAEHGVAVVQSPALARALYHGVRLNREVPQGLYVAVAQVLAYVYQLRRHQGRGPPPQPPGDVAVPQDFRHPG